MVFQWDLIHQSVVDRYWYRSIDQLSEYLYSFDKNNIYIYTYTFFIDAPIDHNRPNFGCITMAGYVRMHHHGWEYAIDPWNIFDYCLVVPWKQGADPCSRGVRRLLYFFPSK